jgi:rifampin ADP-ribosylating transferase
MQFDPNNKVVQLCAEGMELEGQGKKNEALQLFQRAWNIATNDFEKFTSAHYVARHQESTEKKLQWDETALNLALKINGDNIKVALPSLYLNVVKCYEDLGDFPKASTNYENALSHANLLPDDGYGNMIKGGIRDGLSRIKLKS